MAGSGTGTDTPSTPTGTIATNATAPAEVKVDGDLITGVPISSSAKTYTPAQLTSWLAGTEGTTLKVVDADGADVGADMPIATGMKVQALDASGQVAAQTTVIVPGDVLGTGQVSLTQLVTMAKAFTGQQPLTGVYEKAADLDGSGGVSLTDIVMAAKQFKELGLQARA